MQNNTILLTTYPDAFIHKGGGEYELLDVANNLRKLGLVADAYSPYSKNIENYETVIHFSVNASGASIIEAVKSAGKRLILWPNFWHSKQDLNKTDSIVKKFAQLADFIIFKSNIEMENFKLIAPFDSKKVLIVPTPIDPIFTEKSPLNLFKASFDLNDYLLWIGIFEPRKNQLDVIRALRDIKIPIVFIGNYRDKNYYLACKEAAPKHFLFLEPFEQNSDILRAAIREARLYLEPTLEPAGKSVLEAAISGARVLVADAPWEHEHLGKFAVYVNPKDRYSIKDGIEYALSTNIAPEQISVLSKKYLMPHVLDGLVNIIRGNSL